MRNLRGNLSLFQQLATAQISVHLSMIACESSDKKGVNLWDVDSGKKLRFLTGHVGPVFCVSFSPDGKILASASGLSGKSGEVFIWSVATGKRLLTIGGHKSWVFAVAFDKDGKVLASGGGDNVIKLWDNPL
jgi:WD40 repeat protein